MKVLRRSRGAFENDPLPVPLHRFEGKRSSTLDLELNVDLVLVMLVAHVKDRGPSNIVRWYVWQL